jgi:hypothetical protein
VAINYFNRLEPAQEVQRQCQDAGVKAVVIKAVRYFFFAEFGFGLWVWEGRLQERVVVWVIEGEVGLMNRRT